ncbi:hypothetical protein C4546_04440 [Candidatus Parcubacteria bacterium]|jgi:hypothetical protein|nr:MAG: hypothetical protein C4546_04440 [Candidatus Parcubacteria bacterium]
MDIDTLQKAVRDKKVPNAEIVKKLNAYLKSRHSTGGLIGFLHILEKHRPGLFKQIHQAIRQKAKGFK